MISLKNKVVIITGASGGLGKEIAMAVSKESCCLMLAARNVDKLNDVATELQQRRKGLSISICQTDVTCEHDVSSLFAKTMEVFGKIDIVINNAGCGHQALIHETSYEDWERVLKTNLTGVFLCSKEAIQCFKRQKYFGHIITVCSIAGLYGAPGYSCYCAAKHAVAGFMRSMWLETRKHGMRTTTIYPARLATDFFDDYQTKPHDKHLLPPSLLAEYIVLIMKQARLSILIKQAKIFFKRLSMLFH